MGEYEAAEDLCRKISIIFGVDYEWLMDDEVYITVKMYPCSGGTAHRNIQAGSR